jgi:hypothetical protein
LALAFVLVPSIIYLIRMAVATHESNRLNADKPRDQQSFYSAVKTDVMENKLYGIRKKFR